MYNNVRRKKVTDRINSVSYILKEMGTREVYDYKQQKWVPYVSDSDKWYQHLLDIRDGLVEPDYLGRYIVGSGVANFI